MTDVLFRYVLAAAWAPWYRRAFLSRDDMLGANVERIIESAAVRVETAAQYERVTRNYLVGPRSLADKVDFVEAATPQPPAPGSPRDGAEHFALRPTLTIEACPDCRQGRVTCAGCDGTGREPEIWADNPMGDLAAGGRRCGACRGAGTIPHTRCDGEGFVARWFEEVHTYSTRAFVSVHHLPEAPGPVIAAADALLSSGASARPLGALTFDIAAQHLGYRTPELGQVVAQANESHVQAERRARPAHGVPDKPHVVVARSHSAFSSALTSEERLLWLTTQYRIVPVTACVLRIEGAMTALRHWVVGDGDAAVEIAGGTVADTWKIAGWSGLAIAAAAGAPALVTGSAALLTTVGAGLAAAAVGVGRALASRRSRIRTVVVLSHARTSYLALLGAIGAYTKRLEVCGRRYRAQLENVMGTAERREELRCIVVKLDTGERVRLTEVRQQLSHRDVERMTGAVDGLVYLDMPGSTAAVCGNDRIGQASLLLDPDAITVDRDWLSPAGGVALEAIRKAFSREIEADVDWEAIFDRLWVPVRQALSGVGEGEGEAISHAPGGGAHPA